MRDFSFDVKSRHENEEVNLTPLIDVVFLLLIFFMVSSEFIDTQGVDIVLPSGGSPSSEADKNNLEIQIDRHAKIYLDAQHLSLAALENRLKNAPKTALTILADEATSHGTVVSVLSIAQQSGFTQVAIATRTPAPAKAQSN